jgi:hypothetical protein
VPGRIAKLQWQQSEQDVADEQQQQRYPELPEEMIRLRVGNRQQRQGQKGRKNRSKKNPLARG